MFTRTPGSPGCAPASPSAITARMPSGRRPCSPAPTADVKTLPTPSPLTAPGSRPAGSGFPRAVPRPTRPNAPPPGRRAGTSAAPACRATACCCALGGREGGPPKACILSFKKGFFFLFKIQAYYDIAHEDLSLCSAALCLPSAFCSPYGRPEHSQL